MSVLVNTERRLGVFCIVTRPAAWGVEVVIGLGMQSRPVGLFGSVLIVQPGGAVEASGAPSVLNSTPAEAVVSFATTVLLTNFTVNESCSDTPAPSQPATLLPMMLFVTSTLFHPGLRRGIANGRFGNATTSWPFTPCRRSPP